MSQRTFEFKIQRAFIQSVRSALKSAQVPGAGAAVCFPSCPRHSARLLRACRTHLLRAPQPTVARGAHLASVPGSLHRMHMRTARRHAEQAHALGRDASTCFLSDPVKVRPATDPACHGLPPPRLLAFSCASPPRDPGWFSLSSHALFAPATPCPHPLPVCVPLHPKGLASTGPRTCTACALSTRPLSYPSSLLP